VWSIALSIPELGYHHAITCSDKLRAAFLRGTADRRLHRRSGGIFHANANHLGCDEWAAVIQERPEPPAALNDPGLE
jgi:hypothetical protein